MAFLERPKHFLLGGFSDAIAGLATPTTPPSPPTAGGVTNPPDTGLITPTDKTTASSNQAIRSTMLNNATNPSLPAGAVQTPTLLNNTPGTEVASTSGQVGTTPTAQQTTGTSQQVDQTFNQTAANYDPSLIGNNAAQGQIKPEDTVAGQYKNLTDFSNGTPGWAQGALNKTNEQMAARGLGGSSIAAGATMSAILTAALPIAQQDASFNMQMDLANLTNRQQALLSDQAASNAAKQFNATSDNQVTQFFANLTTQIATQNAARADAMSQFNAGQADALAQFNSQLQNQRDQFNAANQLVIDQSNAQWRRSINTTNTAAINAANQVNAQNMFNLSTQAQANLWQQWRDEASWANTDSENALTRAHNLAVAALSRQTAFDLNNQAQQQELAQLMGKFAINVLTS